MQQLILQLSKEYLQIQINNQMDSDQKQQKGQITENDIMQMLHRPKMAIIQSVFQQKEKGLPIQQFLEVMLQHLDYNKKDEGLKLKITLALVDFFKQVDVNGDQSMEWEQFSSHIIQLGLLRNDRSFKNVIKNYFPTEKIVDKQKHQNGVEAISYFQKLKNLFLLEKDSSRFKVYGVNQANLLYQVNAHKGNVLDLQYLENQNLIATSSNDLTINFWDASSFSLKQIVSVPEIQLRLRYASWKQANKQLLYTGGSDAIIHIYDAATLKQKGTISGWNPFYKSDQEQEGHSSPIGDILPIDSQFTLVSACLGGNICLWDSNTHQLKKQLRGHDKGVYSLAWSDYSPLNQCLLSAGLDHEAFVWNTYVKDKIFLLRGHNHPLVGVKCLPESPQIITADIAGMVKVWDVRNFLCVQTFNVPEQELSCFALTYSTTPNQSMKKRIICGGRKIHYFQYDQPRDQFLTDQKCCIKVLFNLTLLCFITLHSDCIKVWDAKNGKLLSVYRGLCSPNAELSCMILDNRQRKLFVGDSDGCIFTVNIKNGAKMKQFQKHTSIVNGLAYWASDKAQLGDERYQDIRRIISISQDPQVFIHDEDSPEEAKTSCRYVMKQHQDACNSVDIQEYSQLLASGSDDGAVIITNLISYRHQILPRGNSGQQIKHVKFLDPYECLVTADSNGNLVFYGMGDNKYRSKILFEKNYLTESKTHKLQQFPVTALAFDRDQKILILGDQFGNVECWDLADLIELLSLTKVQKISLSKRKEMKKMNRNTLNSQESMLVTEVRTLRFSEELIKVWLKMKQCHLDGIISIQLVKQNQAFITSSFDCCCHIWSIKDGKKLGSLLLGGDPHWKITFDLESRRKQDIAEAEELLRKLSKKKSHYFLGEGESDEQIKQYQQMKEGVLKNAKDLIQQQKKHSLLPQPTFDILMDTNVLQKQFFDLEDQDTDLNLMKDVSDFKNHSIDYLTKKKSKNR